MRIFSCVAVQAAGLALSLVGCKNQSSEPIRAAPTAAAPPAVAASGRVEVRVTDRGFEPNRIAAQVGKPLTLVITRTSDQTCATEIVFAGGETQAGSKPTPLPLNQKVEVVYTPARKGEIRFGCGMGMMVGGVLTVQDS